MRHIPIKLISYEPAVYKRLIQVFPEAGDYIAHEVDELMLHSHQCFLGIDHNRRSAVIDGNHRRNTRRPAVALSALIPVADVTAGKVESAAQLLDARGIGLHFLLGFLDGVHGAVVGHF